MFGVSKAAFVILMAVTHGLLLGMCACSIFDFISCVSEANPGMLYGVSSNYLTGATVPVLVAASMAKDPNETG